MSEEANSGLMIDTLPSAGTTRSVFQHLVGKEHAKIEAEKAEEPSENSSQKEVESRYGKADPSPLEPGDDPVEKLKDLEGKKVPEPTEADSDDDEDDVDEEETEEELDDEESEESEEYEDDDEESPTTNQKKPVVATLATGQELEIPPDAQIAVTVDGKKKVVALSELQSSFSGQQVIQRKLSEVDQKSKDLEAKAEHLERYKGAYEELDTKITKALTSMKETKTIDELLSMHEYFGNYDNPVDFKIDLVQAVYPVVETLLSKSPEERHAMLAQEKLDFYDNVKAREKEAEAPKQREQQLKQAIFSKREELKVTDAEWTSALSYVTKLDKEGQWKKFDLDNPTPEQKIQVAFDAVSASRAKTKAKERLEEVAPSFKKKMGEEKFDKTLLNLSKIIKKYENELSDEEIDSLVREAVGTSKTDAVEDADRENLKRKVSKANPKAGKNAAKPKKQIKTWAELRSMTSQLRGNNAN
jgi:hypothetical protein